MPKHSLTTLCLCLSAFALTVLVSTGDVVHAQGVKIQSLGGGRYMTETVREIPIADLSTLRIIGPENLGGSITVTTGSSQAGELEMLKIFKVGSESEAAAFDRDIQFNIKTLKDVLELEVLSRINAPWEGKEQSARVEISITIPEGWDFEFRGRFFEMDLPGPFRRADIQTEYGRIKLANVTQKTRVVGNYTGIEMSKVKGDIVAQTSYADLIVRDAIPSAERPARLTDFNGSIVIEKLAGAVVAESENAPIFLSDVVLLGAGSSLRATNGMIKADISEFGNAELDIQNTNGAVILRVPQNISARLNCSVGTGGSIQTGGLVIQTHADLFGIGRLEGVVGSGKGLIDIDVTGPGQIGIQGF
jgi:hypothetical protein